MPTVIGNRFTATNAAPNEAEQVRFCMIQLDGLQSTCIAD
jgi:hypothetical protein